jgi:hypothetical protein
VWTIDESVEVTIAVNMEDKTVLYFKNYDMFPVKVVDLPSDGVYLAV